MGEDIQALALIAHVITLNGSLACVNFCTSSSLAFLKLGEGGQTPAAEKTLKVDDLLLNFSVFVPGERLRSSSAMWVQ